VARIQEVTVMFVKTGMGLGVLLAMATAGGALGCSATTAAGSSMGPVAPAVAFGASRSDVDPGCSLDGTPRIVATHIAPKAGVTATASGGRIWLRFATAHDPRVSVAIDPETLAVVDDVAEPVEVARDASRGPVEVEVQDHRRLVAWTEGSLEKGLHVRAVTVGDEGVAMGAAIDLGFEGSAIGRPAVAFIEDGRGVLAFIESNDAGFELVVVRAGCGAL
jgi:hypothetical protein